MPGGPLAHVCFLVRDLDRAVEDWKTILGVVDPAQLEQPIVMVGRWEAERDVMSSATFVNPDGARSSSVPLNDGPLGRASRSTASTCTTSQLRPPACPAWSSASPTRGIGLRSTELQSDPGLPWHTGRSSQRRAPRRPRQAGLSVPAGGRGEGSRRGARRPPRLSGPPRGAPVGRPRPRGLVPSSSSSAGSRRSRRSRSTCTCRRSRSSRPTSGRTPPRSSSRSRRASSVAVGQLVFGSLSDARGRRGPLLVGLVVYTVASALCALAPDALTLAVSASCRASPPGPRSSRRAQSSTTCTPARPQRRASSPR